MSETWVLNETITGILPTDSTPFVDGNGTRYFGLWKKKTSLLYYTDENLDVTTVAYNNGSWSSEAYKTITFDTAPTGTLLTWLQANGTKQSTEPTFSFTHRYKSDNLIGTGAYKFRPYTLTQQTTLISFTIEGTEYQAELGMTWAQWVDSSYNTGGFAVDVGDNTIRNGPKYLYTSSNMQLVFSSNTVISGGAYTLAYGGAGN